MGSLKKTAVILILLSVIAIIFSCAGKEANENAGSSDILNTEKSEMPAETERTRGNYPDDLPDTDLDGVRFRISVTDKYEYEMTAEEENGDICNDAVYTRNRLTEERFNLEIVSVVTEMEATDDQAAHSGYISKTVLAGDDAFDLAGLYVWQAGGCILEGCFIDWKGVPYVDYSKPWWIAAVNEAFTCGGRQYVAVSDLSVTTLQLTYAYLFNKKIADNYGIGDLYQTVGDGKWTIGVVSELAKRVYSDLNGSGKPDAEDLYAFVGDKVTGLDAYLPAFGQPLMTKDAEGYPRVSVNTERTVAALEKIYDLYYNSQGSYVVEYWDKYTMFADSRSLFIQARIITLYDQLRDMDVDYGILPYPKFDEAQERYLVNSVDNYSVLGIPVTASDTGMIGLVTEALSAESYRSVVPAFYEVALQTKYTRDEDSVAMLDIIMNGRNYDFSILHGSALNNLPYIFRELIANKKSDFASKYASVEDSLKSSAEKLIEAYKNIG